MYPTRVLVTLIALVGISALFILGIVYSGKSVVESTPWIITVLGFTTLIVQSLIAALKTHKNVENAKDQATEANNKLDKVLNGEMDAKIARVVRAELMAILEPHLDDNGKV